MRGIEIHYEQSDGQSGVINYLTGENSEVFASKPTERETRRRNLIERATAMAGRWSVVFPDDKFSVVEA